MKTATPKPSFVSSLLAPLTGADRLALEKSRLEAFLGAFPGEYCGFHEDGSVAYSEGFKALLGLNDITRIEDIQAALDTADAAALEGMFLALEQSGKAFSFHAHNAERTKILRLRGAAGQAVNGDDRFHIVWLEDITDEEEAQQKLRRAKEQAANRAEEMQAALEALPHPVWLRDAHGDLEWVNSAYGALISTSPAEAIASQYEIILSSKTISKTLKDMAAEALSTGRAQTVQSHLIAAGKRKWMSLSEMPLPGSGKTIGYAFDLTHEEELQGALDRNLAANKSLMEQLRSAIALFGPEQQLEFFNSAFAQLWGLEEKWLNGRPKLGDILEKLREERRLPEQADFRHYKQGWLDMFTRLIDPYEEMMYLPDGSALRLLVVPHPMGGLMMTFEDVTSRLELESSYNTLIAVQKETLDNLSEGVAVFGGDGRIKFWNPAYASLWKLNPEDLDNGPHISQLVDKKQPLFPTIGWPDMRSKLIALALERSEGTGKLSRKDDVHVWYTTVPLPDGGVMVTFRDITDAARIEHALREKNSALEAAEQLKTDFLANVSYQLRTPLNAIMGFAEILGNQYFGELNQRQQEYTTGISEAGERLIGLIDDILDLSTIEAGYLELKKENLALAPLLTALHDLTIDWARKHKIDVKLSCPENIGHVMADERRLKQALLNLIRNAIHFTPEGGKIAINCERIGDKSIRISVEDTGIGIAEEDLARVFQPFERAGQHNQQSGAGLGLTLVKNIVALHDGTIDLKSKPGQGTQIQITLPSL